MTVELPSELEMIVNEKVASGRYANAGEFVREAILLAAEFDRVRQERLHEAIQIGIEQADRRDFSTRTIQEIITAKEIERYG